MNDNAIKVVKHYFWRCGIDLTDRQATDIIGADSNLSAMGVPGLASALASTLGRQSMSDIERFFPKPSRIKRLLWLCKKLFNTVGGFLARCKGFFAGQRDDCL